MGIVIGVIVVLGLAALFAVLTCKGKHSDLFRWLLIAIFVAFCLTWIVPYGYFNEANFYEYGMNRLGLSDVSNVLYYSAYFGLSNLVYLFVVGGFYGIISKTNSYQALVKKTAKALKGKELLFMIITSTLLVVLTSLMRNTLALLVFIPFLITVLLNMKVDKLSAFIVTFGSLLAGLCAATYGTDGLYWFNYYVGLEVSKGLIYRVIMAAFALVLYEVYFVISYKKRKRLSDDKNLEEDPYAVEEVKGKAAAWPMIVTFAILLVFVVLGFIPWEANFKITCFTKFHEWLTGLTIGKEFKLFSYILGTGAASFGNFEINTLTVILLVVSVIVAFMSRYEFNEYLNNFGEGFKKMLKPVCLYVLVYVVFVIAYMSPFIPTFTNWAYGLTKNFNPYIATVVAFITSIFHTDLGYTGYVVGAFLTKGYESSLALAHTLYITTYGIAQIFMPVSGILMIGLSYLKIDYKSWFKYIWIFAVAMIVVLLVLATIVNY